MLIDFDEQKFLNEVKSIARSYGASSSDSRKIASVALSAVYKASKTVK